MAKKRKRLPGRVEKVIKPAHPKEPEKAQIGIEGADHLYREIRIENTLTDDKGEKTQLEQGEEVEVIVETKAESEPAARAAKNGEKS